MEMRSKFTLGTFLLLSSLVSLSYSYSTDEDSSQLMSRRLLNQASDMSIQQYLIPHNIIREERRLPPLEWSKKLAKFASWWAHKRQADCALIHSNSDYGENLFWGSGKDWKPGDAVAAWAEEKDYYDHKKNACTKNKDCLHYTQMIWKDSLKIGCAKVVCRSGDTLIACNYDPHGNVIGQKPF
ncbi:hypothetical protein Gogos_004678 [Gossypium gossypioides]|uniref:SCP domain-containing protein n=1 Tax=Gossypium gossypioides TaxID=34282 RepID=A0A7J9CH19_GOSGO|nr:hypothetical protein [Gossypium gossypioides]